MTHFQNGLLYSLSYFTTLPFKAKDFTANKEFYNGVVYGLPLAGLILGVLICFTFIVLPFESLYKAILLSIVYLFLYGFIHLEAVCDTIDGYYASLSGKDIHKIMKEPQIGAIGALGGFCFVLLKILALSYLLYHECYLVIILSLIASRASLFFALDLEFHSKSGFILSLQESFKTPSTINTILFPIRYLTHLILKKLQKHIGFLNGDTLGFNIELQELIYLNIGILLFI
jgi:adenosylcobinamide-GDP ribazoletransferase